MEIKMTENAQLKINTNKNLCTFIFKTRLWRTIHHVHIDQVHDFLNHNAQPLWEGISLYQFIALKPFIIKYFLETNTSHMLFFSDIIENK